MFLIFGACILKSMPLKKSSRVLNFVIRIEIYILFALTLNLGAIVNNKLNQRRSLTNIGGESEILESFLHPSYSPRNTDENCVVAVLSEVATENWNKNYG